MDTDTASNRYGSGNCSLQFTPTQRLPALHKETTLKPKHGPRSVLSLGEPLVWSFFCVFSCLQPTEEYHVMLFLETF